MGVHGRPWQCPRAESGEVWSWGENWKLWCRDGPDPGPVLQAETMRMSWCQNVWNTAKTFLKGFSPKMLTNLGESPGEAEGGGWWQLQLTRKQTLAATSKGFPHPWTMVLVLVLVGITAETSFQLNLMTYLKL